MSHDQSRIWEYYQNEGSDSFRGARPRLAWLAARLAPGTDVLDVGVGDGTFERFAAVRGLRVHVLDPDESAIARARSELGLGDRARAGRAERLPWPEATFDAVVMSEVLEHLDDATLAAALAEVRRVLRPGGLLIGTVPADEALEAQRVVCPDCGRRFHRWGHEQSYSPERLEALLRTHVGEAAVARRWFVAWSQLNAKGKLQAAARKTLAAFGSWGAGHNLVFRARKPL